MWPYTRGFARCHRLRLGLKPLWFAENLNAEDVSQADLVNIKIHPLRWQNEAEGNLACSLCTCRFALVATVPWVLPGFQLARYFRIHARHNDIHRAVSFIS